MTSAAGGPPPFVDVSGRMEVFGRLFGEQVGIPEPSSLPTPEALIAVVKARVPRSGVATDEAPVFEAAAYIGEWLRRRATASWVAEGPFEPHLQLVDETHAIVYLLPMVQLLRTAASAGYDGIPLMITRVLEDVGRVARPSALDQLRVEPLADRPAVVGWARENQGVKDATRAALWRRCAMCSTVDERSLTLHRPADDWEGEAATAASILSSSPFTCPCGGPAGSTTRFLMVRNHEGMTRLGDIYLADTHTRVGCWTLKGDIAEPFDALSLASRDEMVGG